MMFWNRTIRIGIGLLCLGWLSGCCGMQRVSSCGGCGLGAAMHSSVGCGASCGVSCDTGCDTGCGVSGCRGGCGLFHSEFLSRIQRGIVGGCASGCGEVYYDEQSNEPPCVDPCSGYGDFVGGTGCCPPPRLAHRLRELWGLPYMGTCNGCETGCSACSSCGTGNPVYASHHAGQYCPSCRDGSAGNPSRMHHGRVHSQSNSTLSESAEEPAYMDDEPQPMHTPTPTPEPIVPKAKDSPQPIPDSNARNLRSRPAEVRRSEPTSTRRSRPQVAPSEPRQARSRLVAQ